MGTVNSVGLQGAPCQVSDDFIPFAGLVAKRGDKVVYGMLADTYKECEGKDLRAAVPEPQSYSDLLGEFKDNFEAADGVGSYQKLLLAKAKLKSFAVAQKVPAEKAKEDFQELAVKVFEETNAKSKLLHYMGFSDESKELYRQADYINKALLNALQTLSKPAVDVPIISSPGPVLADDVVAILNEGIISSENAEIDEVLPFKSMAYRLSYSDPLLLQGLEALVENGSEYALKVAQDLSNYHAAVFWDVQPVSSDIAPEKVAAILAVLSAAKNDKAAEALTSVL